LGLICDGLFLGPVRGRDASTKVLQSLIRNVDVEWTDVDGGLDGATHDDLRCRWGADQRSDRKAARTSVAKRFRRWTGRPGHPVHVLLGICLVPWLYAQPAWTCTLDLIADNPALASAIGLGPDDPIPTRSAVYRFHKKLREHPELLDEAFELLDAALCERLPEPRPRRRRYVTRLPHLPQGDGDGAQAASDRARTRRGRA
jgi:hypothetical protein